MSSSKRYAVYFNQGQDVMHTNDIEYEKQKVEDTTIIFLSFKWNSDRIKMPLHQVTYMKESNFDG